VKLLFKLFFDICLLRAKPQDVPSSSALMLLTLFVVIASGVPAIMDRMGGLGPAIMIGLFDAALILAILKICLTLMKLSSRLVQTATAMFGTGVIINLFTLPVMRLLNVSPKESASLFLGALLYFALLVWIDGHLITLPHVFY